MTVGELKKALEDAQDDLKVFVYEEHKPVLEPISVSDMFIIKQSTNETPRGLYLWGE